MYINPSVTDIMRKEGEKNTKIQKKKYKKQKYKKKITNKNTNNKCILPRYNK